MPPAPPQDFRPAAIGRTREPRQDHGIELEPLGTVQRHDLHARAAYRIGLGVAAGPAHRRAPANRARRRRPRASATSEGNARWRRDRSARQRRTPAERQPRPAHSRRNACAPARVERRESTGATRARRVRHVRTRRPAIASGTCIRPAIEPSRRASAAATMANRIGQHEPAPGRAASTASQASRSAG